MLFQIGRLCVDCKMATMMGARTGSGWLTGQRLTSSWGLRHPKLHVIACASDSQRPASNKGKQFENKQRRRGRPAWLRTPYDTPLRDGNRDRLIGLLTERAAKTLMVYLMETNPTVYSWLVNYYKENPIPKNGNWDDVSGETFLRKMLAMPVMDAKLELGREELFDNLAVQDVDPRNMAQRIMEIRSQLATEFIQDLQAVAEENSLLLRETLTGSLSTDAVVEHPCDVEGDTSRPCSPGGRQQRPESPPADKDLRASFRPRPVRPSRPLEPLDGSSSSSPGISMAEKASLVAALSAAFSKEMPVTPGDASHPELLDSVTSSDASSGSSPVGSMEEAPQAATSGSNASLQDQQQKQSVAGDSSSSSTQKPPAAASRQLPVGWGPRSLPVVAVAAAAGSEPADAAATAAAVDSATSAAAAAAIALQNNILECSGSSLGGSAWPSSSEEEEALPSGAAALVDQPKP